MVRAAFTRLMRAGRRTIQPGNTVGMSEQCGMDQPQGPGQADEVSWGHPGDLQQDQQPGQMLSQWTDRGNSLRGHLPRQQLTPGEDLRM